MVARVLYRVGTSTLVDADTYILADGELGWDDSNNVHKVGNGVDKWSDLPEYVMGSVSGGGGDTGPVSWDEVIEKPTEFPPAAHGHDVASITDSGAAGRVIVQAETEAAAREAIGAGVPASGIGKYLHNFTPGKFLKFSKAIQRQRIGEADAKILCPGDSISAGFGGTDTVMQNNNSWPYRLVELMPNAARGMVPAFEPSASADNRYSGWGVDTTGSFFGWSPGAYQNYRVTATSAQALTFTPGIECNRFTVWYLSSQATGAMDVQATGGSATTVPAGSGATILLQSVTVNAAAVSASNVLTITSGTLSGGDKCYVLAVEAWRSDKTRIRISNVSVNGSNTIGWDGSSGATNISPKAMIQNYAPDLTVICLSGNDAALDQPANDVMTRIQSIIAACKVSGDVLIVTPPPVLTGGREEIAGYRDAMLELGEPVFDLYGVIEDIGGWTAYDTAGYVSADDLHGNNYSYAQWAGWLFEAIQLCI